MSKNRVAYMKVRLGVEVGGECWGEGRRRWLEIRGWRSSCINYLSSGAERRQPAPVSSPGLGRPPPANQPAVIPGPGALQPLIDDAQGWRRN